MRWAVKRQLTMDRPALPRDEDAPLPAAPGHSSRWRAMRSFSGAARELGVSRSAVSQAVRQLEEQLRVVLLARTTRSVSLTDAGRRLVDGAGPALGQAVAALTEVSAQPGEAVGRVRLSVPRMAVPFVIDSGAADVSRAPPAGRGGGRHRGPLRGHRGGGLRRRRAPERGHRARHGAGAPHRRLPLRRGGRARATSSATARPERPEDLLRHECITFRSQTTGALYAWELERGRRTWRVPVRGGVVTNDSRVTVSLAEAGAGAHVRLRADGAWSSCARDG